MTIQEMTANFDILTHAYYFGAIAYVIFLFCCHIIGIFQALKAEHEVIYVQKISTPSKAILALPTSDKMTLRQLRDHIRINDLQARVKSVAGRSVSNCSKAELLKALA